MEVLYQDETASPEQELTPQDQIKLQWRQQPGFIPFVRQKNVIDQNAELLPYAGSASLRGWIPPRLFALQGLVLLSLVASLVNWQMTRRGGNLEEQIVALQANAQTEIKRQEGINDAIKAEITRISNAPRSTFYLRMTGTRMGREEALQELYGSLEESQRSEKQYKESVAAQEHKLRAQQSAQAIANSGSPLIFSLALVLAAGLVSKGAPRDLRSRQSRRRLADYYLYFVTAEGLWPNLVLVVFLHAVLSRSAWGLAGLFDSVGPLFWVVFWIGFYLLLLRYFVVVARDIYQAAQVRLPANEWSPDNRMLLSIHNSFLAVFAGMEAAFLALCYLLYLGQKALG
jgi:hypothetical protein